MRGLYCELTRFIALVALSSTVIAFAQVTLDGTLGPAGSLPGPNYQIPAEVGRQVGSNLFHSFGKFSIYTGESATFTGPGSVKNIIGRVTGGQASWLDGTLRSTLPNADLYLLNPAGILFGPNASLDVQGSFHASTANYLRLGEEGRFDVTEPRSSLLTSAPPSAFGFLGDNPAPLSIQGSKLRVPEGKTLSLIGGDLTINNSQLAAPGGQLQIASAGSAGEVVVSEAGLKTTSPIQRGAISVSTSLLDASSNAAGKVHIIGGRIKIAASQVGAETGNREGGPIDIEVNSLFLSGNAHIASTTRGEGNAGAVNVSAEHIEIRGGSMISSTTFASGKAGSVMVDTGRLLISGDGSSGITSITSFAAPGSSGDTGSVTVKAKHLSIARNGATNLTGIGTLTLPDSSGDAGETRIAADEIEVRDGGNIGSSTFAQGNVGTVMVEANRLLIDGDDFFDRENRIFTGIVSSAQSRSTGNAGEIQITANDIEIRKGGAINSSAIAKGNAGMVKVKAKRLYIDGAGAKQTSTSIASNTEAGPGDAGKVIVEADYLLIDGNDSLQITGIESGVFPASELFPSLTGNAGEIQVIAKDLELRNGGTISSSSAFAKGNAGVVTVTTDRLFITGIGLARNPNTNLPVPSNISSSAELGSSGAGGTVKVKANEILLTNQGIITARSSSQQNAGDITIQANNLRLQDAEITTQAEQSGGGNIDIQARDLVTLIGSSITTSVASGDQNAGNITIAEPAALTLVEGSQIEANTFGGKGGFIRIKADTILQSPDSVIQAEALSKLGIDGEINVDSPDVDITAGLVPLPATFFDATTILAKPCAERSGADVIGLTLRKYEVLPDSPYALQVHLPRVASALSITGQASATQNIRTSTNWLLPSVGECKE